MQTFVCLSTTFNQASRDTYASGIIITVIKRNLFSFSSYNLTHNSIKLHLFLFRSYFSGILFQSKPKVHLAIFFPIQLKMTGWQKWINFQVLFVFPRLLIPDDTLFSPGCWSLCSHHWGCFYRTADDVKHVHFSVVLGQRWASVSRIDILCNHTASQQRANRGWSIHTIIPTSRYSSKKQQPRSKHSFIFHSCQLFQDSTEKNSHVSCQELLKKWKWLQDVTLNLRFADTLKHQSVYRNATALTSGPGAAGTGAVWDCRGLSAAWMYSMILFHECIFSVNYRCTHSQWG